MLESEFQNVKGMWLFLVGSQSV